jgi:energy-coupling factor transporter ATP-binding protein EcfA2
MTRVETLALFATLNDVPRWAQRLRIDGFSATMGLDAHVRRRVAVTPGVCRQRLHFALSLLHDPELLVLARTHGRRRPVGSRLHVGITARLRDQRCTVVIAAHDVPDVERHCDRAAFLHQGRVEHAQDTAPTRPALSFGKPIMRMLFFGFLFHRYAWTTCSKRLPTSLTYIDFSLPGVWAMTVMFGACQSDIGLIRDMQTGFVSL